MKILFILSLISVIQLSLYRANAQSKAADSKNQPSNAKKPPLKKSPAPAPSLNEKIVLKPNEYLLKFDTGDKIFSTKMFEGLNLSTDCFEFNLPKCDAYLKSLTKMATISVDKMKSPYHNNLGAIHCELLGGKGLIAKTSKGNDDDFCVFKDGSMVSSWSAYYKNHPPVEAKAKSK